MMPSLRPLLEDRLQSGWAVSNISGCMRALHMMMHMAGFILLMDACTSWPPPTAPPLVLEKYDGTIFNCSRHVSSTNVRFTSRKPANCTASTWMLAGVLLADSMVMQAWIVAPA